VTFKFQQIVRSWYSVHVTFVCTALWTIYLRSNLPNLFKIRRVLRKLWWNTFWCVFYAQQCIGYTRCIECYDRCSCRLNKCSFNDFTWKRDPFTRSNTSKRIQRHGTHQTISPTCSHRSMGPIAHSIVSGRSVLSWTEMFLDNVWMLLSTTAWVSVQSATDSTHGGAATENARSPNRQSLRGRKMLQLLEARSDERVGM